MAADDIPLDDKAKRMRDLLSSFYAPDPSTASNTSSKYVSLDAINTTSFDADQYMNLLSVLTFPYSELSEDKIEMLLSTKSNLEGLLQRHVEMAAEIKILTLTCRYPLIERYLPVNSNNYLLKDIEAMAHDETFYDFIFCGKEQFIYDLPTRLGKCIKSEAYADAVRFYTGAMPIFEEKVCLDSESVQVRAEAVVLLKQLNFQSFQEMHFLSKVLLLVLMPESTCTFQLETFGPLRKVNYVLNGLQASFMYQSRRFTELSVAVNIYLCLCLSYYGVGGFYWPLLELLWRGWFVLAFFFFCPGACGQLEGKLLETLEKYLITLQLNSRAISTTSLDSDEPSKQGSSSDALPGTAHEASTREFVEAVHAYRLIFPDSEDQLIKLAQDLVTKHFESTQQQIRKQISSSDLLGILRVIWTDVLLMEEVLPEAALSDFSLEAAHVAVKQYVASTFSNLLLNVSGQGALRKSKVDRRDALTKVQTKKGRGRRRTSFAGFTGGKQEGSNSRQHGHLTGLPSALDDNLGLLVKLRDFIIDWVQEGFQDFFGSLNDQFLSLSGKNHSISEHQGLTEGTQGEKFLAGLVLVLAQLSVFIEQSAIPRITEARSHQIAI
ncbi:Vacuolar protein sorting-associated protein 51-like [Vitis vinifera]|uniref:Vacuolar protein sorting-associated protein 51 homolog n=1 Tax=Vitis vinifera TaxID=29760 RepID=A0A438IY62_VITVI|nr:Vacuolar protein sorting-associated protein 51-like [Vitis vinifera]